VNLFNRVWWRPPVADEVDDELTFHREMRVRELVERGMDPQAARREAQRRAGDIERVRATLRGLAQGETGTWNARSISASFGRTSRSRRVSSSRIPALPASRC
jgi:hypothetical protein